MNHFEENSKRIEGEVSRREWNKIRGRFIESYLILHNPKMDDGGWMEKDLNYHLQGEWFGKLRGDYNLGLEHREHP